MYEYLKGIITKITAKYIVLEANGIGYILHVANPYAYSGQVNQEAQIYVHQVVREDAHLLYGFRSEDEKKLFLSLISVSGIGPVSALAIIAADDNAGLVQAIETKNITYLTKFPKIGKKTAQQMVLDLEGKVVVAGDDLPAKVAVTIGTNRGRSRGCPSSCGNIRGRQQIRCLQSRYRSRCGCRLRRRKIGTCLETFCVDYCGIYF